MVALSGYERLKRHRAKTKGQPLEPTPKAKRAAVIKQMMETQGISRRTAYYKMGRLPVLVPTYETRAKWSTRKAQDHILAASLLLVDDPAREAHLKAATTISARRKPRRDPIKEGKRRAAAERIDWEVMAERRRNRVSLGNNRRDVSRHQNKSLTDYQKFRLTSAYRV